jgi:hypothetical protein
MKKDKSNVNKKNEEAKRKAEEDKKNELNKVVKTLHGAEIDSRKTGQTYWTIIGTKNIPKALREQGHYVTVFQTFGKEWTESIQIQRENKVDKFVVPISDEASKIFLFFLVTMNWGNWVYLTKKMISEYCGLGKNQVRASRGLNELLELGLIEAHQDESNPNVIHYRVNINAGWKGSMTAWNDEHNAKEKGKVRIDWKTAKEVQKEATKRSEKGWDSLNYRTENDNE